MGSTLSCSVWRVKKLLAAPIALVCAGALAGCSVMDLVGPRPNKEIMALARQAAADEAAGSALRGEQKRQLIDEMLRLCGTDPTGAVPSSCAVELGELPVAAGADALVAKTVVAAEKVPAESRDLVVAQAVDALAVEPVEPAGASAGAGAGAGADENGESDSAAASAMLAAEDAYIYGLGIALAYADGDTRGRIERLTEASRERSAALALRGEYPAGYEFPAGAVDPTDAAGAAELVDTLHTELVQRWRLAAARAETGAWRDEAIHLAAHAQRAA